MKKLRILKVLVQPVAFVDDHETGELSEVAIQPIAVAFKDWQEFASGGLSAAVAQLEGNLNAPDPAP